MKKFKFIILFIILSNFIIISGCCHSKYYGDYSNASKTTLSDIANHITIYLVNQYPPSYSKLEIEEPAKNLFEIELIDCLRIHGYHIPHISSTSYQSIDEKMKDNLYYKQELTNFRYIINRISPKLYQVTIYLGSRSHSRLFKEKYNGKVYPLGPWTKESHNKLKINY